MTLVTHLADLFSVNEPSIKLLLTVYSGYLFALVHRAFPVNTNKSLQYVYFTVTSLSLLYWNYGWDFYHSLLCVTVQWLIFVFLGGKKIALICSFLFQMGYLLCGYLYYSTTSYDINWCLPHCILTLRMIGLAFDVYDGHRNENVTPEQKERAIEDVPSLLEILGFAYLYCGYIVGPQYPLQRVRAMLDGELTDSPGNKPNSLIPGFRRGLSGTIMLGVQAYIDSKFNIQYYTTDEFQNSEFPYKFICVVMIGHSTLLRYVAIWMINEGTCIISGLGYRKDEKTNEVKWDAVRNVSLRNFIMAQSFHDVIQAFNINTNGWVMRYVFKRLRFVGNRTVSHIAALAFLAAWHGIHEGYFTCFAYEFLTMSVEKPLTQVLRDWWLVKKLRAELMLSWIPPLVGFIYLHSLLGYCMIDFALLKWKVYQPVYVSIYYFGHVFFLILHIVLLLHSFLASKQKSKSETNMIDQKTD